MRSCVFVCFAATILSSLATAQGSAPAVRINEIRIDQTSTDSDEFFELFLVDPGPTGGGDTGVPLAGLTYVVIGDGTPLSGVIEEEIDLTGYCVGLSGFFVAAEPTFTTGAADLITELNFENSDNVTHLLVWQYFGSIGLDLDVDDDGVLDLTPWAQIVDGVSLVESYTGGDRYYASAVGPEGLAVPGHIERCSDGTGPWRIAPFETLADTPGSANLCAPSAYNYCLSGVNGAVMGMTGSISVSSGDFVLTASPVLPTSGMFLMSTNQYGPLQIGPVPLGGNAQGFRCLQELIRLPPAVPPAPGSDTATRSVNFAEFGITAGSTWNFQYWFRQLPIFTAEFDMTDGLTVLFAP